MKISYNWLKDYLPQHVVIDEVLKNSQKLSDILTSVGLEVENLHPYEAIKNSLEGLIIAEVITCEKHPDADKLKVTTVSNGHGKTLQIVCGAPNVNVGQKVVLAPVGATLYPTHGEPLTIKKTKIRGVESNGMLCAEDEIGLGNSHEGIIVLDNNAIIGTKIFDYYKPYKDLVIEIGLTPNHMDAMSHIGVAKDVCAYLSHHNKAEIKPVLPFPQQFKNDNETKKIDVIIQNTEACSRYAGIVISGIKVNESPAWLQNKLKTIGARPISNIVDITNFILHETGQPLHAFDADKIAGNKIIVKTFSKPISFITLDEKVRNVNNEDIMICDGNEKPVCFGGVFGGLESGVTEDTTNIFLESAWFNPAYIRKTSFRHNLRTEAAVRFEKGVDISNTVNVLKRAALLIKEICGGSISSQIIDVYPSPKTQTEVILQDNYLKKLSGKNYQRDDVTKILKSLNFTILREGVDEIKVGVPFSNPDITLPADIVEEIMRIDGLDNIEIPTTIKMSPSINTMFLDTMIQDKVSSWLIGNGFSEIFTNSITNSKYFDESTLAKTVKIINSLSEDLNVMRPSMMPTGLESIAYNINRKNIDLLFFEFGKTYFLPENKKYDEIENLAIYCTGTKKESDWKNKNEKADIYFIKGICNNIFKLAGLKTYEFLEEKIDSLDNSIKAISGKTIIAEAGSVQKSTLEKFSIKQPVFYLCIKWRELINAVRSNKIVYEEVSKFPQVQRDLSVIVDRSVSYQSLQQSVNALKISKLKNFKLFDVFESEKIGSDKKSMAVNFTFYDKEKTLTDEETDSIMNKIIKSIEKDLSAEIRKNN